MKLCHFNSGSTHPRYSSPPGIAGRLPFFSLCAIFLAAETLPSLVVYFHISNSLAAGLIVAAAIAIALVSVNFAIVSARTGGQTVFHAHANSIVLIGTTLALICAHGVIASRLVPVDFHRFALSLIPLVFLLAGATSIAYVLRTATPRQIDSMVWVCFWIFIGFIILYLIHLEPDSSAFNRAFFPFPEPSHFALAFGPIYLYRSISAPRHRQLAWIAFGAITALVVRDVTLLAFAVGAAVLCRRLLILTFAAACVILTTAATHLSYFTSRADISSHSRNLSALVYLQGWELLLRSLRLSHGWGLGFQQLGTFPLHVSITRVIRGYTQGSALNTMNGSFVFSKFASELGVFGVLLTIAFIILCIKSIVKLRAASGSVPQDTLARCIIVAFGVDMFIRGPGYFYGAPLLFLGAALSLSPGYGLLRRKTSRDGAETLVLR